jgi:hypothetical protein
MGAGPNPAQQQFAANTGTNVANQAALAAGQRGAAQNVGLMERNVAQQGAATQQQAAGQAATLQAQQQLTAEQNAAAQQQAIAQGITANTAAQNQLLSTGVTGTNAQNTAINTSYLTPEQINAQTAQANAGTTSKMIGGLTGGLGSASSSITSSLAEGGEVKRPMTTQRGPITDFSGLFPSAQGMPTTTMAKGGKVPAMVSPGEVILSKKEMQSPKAPQIAAEKAKKGHKVAGKPKVAGDSLKNDTKPTMLEEGGAVVKRTAAQDPSKAAQFVQQIKAKQGMKRKK